MPAEAAGAGEAAPALLSARIVQSYLAAADGDPHRALARMAEDAVADLCEAECRSRRQDRLISAGYVRAALPCTRQA